MTRAIERADALDNWPSMDEVEWVVAEIQSGTASPLRVARLCAMALAAVRQRNELRAKPPHLKP